MLCMDLNNSLAAKRLRWFVTLCALGLSPRRVQGRALFFNMLLLGLVSWGLPARAITLQELRNEKDLTPARLMSYFRDFSFKLGEDLQSPDAFLAARSGDCDDFASLAAQVLREKHYTTRLVAVFMAGQTHVVCYVKEAGCYLDYNCRAQASPLQPTDGTLKDIANKVSACFRTTWRSVAEFTEEADHRTFGQMAFR